jgi:hypothetical protein
VLRPRDRRDKRGQDRGKCAARSRHEAARHQAAAAAKRSVCQSLSPSQKSIIVSRFA